MKLIRITHYRCADYDCQSFVFAPSDWDDDRIDTEIYAAQKDYLAQYAGAFAAKDGPPYPGHQPPYDKFPDRTAGEIKAEFQEKQAARREWEQAQAKTKRSFEEFLKDHGFVSIWQADDRIEKFSCDWGHRHGMSLDYGNDSNLNNMPTPDKLVKLDAGQEVEDDELW